MLPVTLKYSALACSRRGSPRYVRSIASMGVLPIMRANERRRDSISEAPGDDILPGAGAGWPLLEGLVSMPAHAMLRRGAPANTPLGPRARPSSHSGIRRVSRAHEVNASW